MKPSPRSFGKALGPGLLFAGAAVGVSHLVQSTRAGAMYGLGLVLVILAAVAIKYPAFSFGPRYAAATGTSLLEGYRRQGRWALALYAVATVGTMFTVEAAVAIVTAGLAVALLGLTVPPVWVAAGLIVACAAIVAVGHYRWLDRIMKVVVAVLTIATLAATALVLPEIDWGAALLLPDAGMVSDRQTVFFVAAVVGWMPSALDISVWHSLWSLARRRDTEHAASVREALLDFDIGYAGTAVLALCFVLLGAGVMHGAGIEPEDSAGAFAAQVISLYTETLGEFSRPLIGGCAFMVMFSTTLTVVDGFARALSALVDRFRAPETPGGTDVARDLRRLYWLSVIAIGAGAVILLEFFLTRLITMVDVATTLSFLTAPVLAILNHRAVTGKEVSPELRPRPAMVLASVLSIALLSAFAGYYLYLRAL